MKRTRSRRPVGSLGGICALVMLTACGTTVDMQAGAAGGDPGLGRATAATPGGVTSPAGPTGLEASDTTAPSGASGAGGAALSGIVSGGGGGQSGSAAAPDSARGAAAASRPVAQRADLQIGLMYTANSAAQDAALGQAGLDRGDPKAQYTALINDLNKRGGIAGRRVVPVYFEWDATSTDPADSQYAAACAHYTQDNHVFAVIGGGPGSYQACLERAGVLVVDASPLTLANSETFRRYQHFVQSAGPNLDRLADVEAGQLPGTGYFGSTAKVGILTFDYPEFVSAVRGRLIPRLRKVPGVSLDDRDVVYARTTSNQDAVADISSAALRMKADGVTHVVIFDTGGGLTLYFSRTAQGQDYHPRYGINSQNAVQVIVESGLGDAEQFRGAVGVGWAPIYDLPYSQYSKTKGNATRDRCLAFMRARGLGPTDANSEGVALTNCAAIWFLEMIGNRAAGPLSATSAITAVDALGSTWTDPSTFTTSFSARKHDGAAAVRRMAFDSGCSCLRYTSAAMSFG